MQFEEVGLDSSGYFSFEGSGTECESTVTLDAMIGNFVDMENLIKKNFMMKSEKLSKFSDSNPIQLTLREDIECMNQDLTELNGKYKDLVEKFYSQNKDNDSKNQLDQQEKISDLEKQISFRDIDLQE